MPPLKKLKKKKKKPERSAQQIKQTQKQNPHQTQLERSTWQKTQPNQTNPHPKSNKPKRKTHHCRPIERNPMVGGSDNVVDGTTSSAAWRGMVIRPWVVVDVVGRVCVAVLVDGDLRV